MTTITTSEQYIDGIGYFINDNNELVANITDTIPNVVLREVDGQETELTDADTTKAKTTRKTAATSAFSEALVGRLGTSPDYAWMLENIPTEAVATWDDMTIKEHVLQIASNIYDGIENDLIQALTFNEFLTASDFDGALNYVTSKRDDARSQVALDQVMTAGEAFVEFGLSESTVRQAINRGTIPARKSGETWLVLRSDAQARWDKKVTTLLDLLTGTLSYSSTWGIYAERIDGQFTRESPARFGQRQFANGGLADDKVYFTNNEYATDQIHTYLDDTGERDEDTITDLDRKEAADYLIDKINETVVER